MNPTEAITQIPWQQWGIVGAVVGVLLLILSVVIYQLFSQIKDARAERKEMMDAFNTAVDKIVASAQDDRKQDAQQVAALMQRQESLERAMIGLQHDLSRDRLRALPLPTEPQQQA